MKTFKKQKTRLRREGKFTNKMQKKVQQGEEHTFTLYLRTELWQGTAINFLVTDSPVRLVTVMTLHFTSVLPFIKNILYALFFLL